MDIEAPEWAGWYFEHGYLCSPQGDRFHPLMIKACFFWKQLDEVRDVLYSRPALTTEDVLMEVSNRRIEAFTVDHVQQEIPAGIN